MRVTRTALFARPTVTHSTATTCRPVGEDRFTTRQSGFAIGNSFAVCETLRKGAQSTAPTFSHLRSQSGRRFTEA